MTRKEFLKTAFFSIFSVIMLPGIRKLTQIKKNFSYREAKYYKTLAG